MSLRQIRAVTHKEIIYITRDRSSFILVILMPMLLLLLMSYALAVDIRHVPVAVLDQDRSSMSRAFIQGITAGDDLDLFAQVSDQQHDVGDRLLSQQPQLVTDC